MFGIPFAAKQQQQQQQYRSSRLKNEGKKRSREKYREYYARKSRLRWDVIRLIMTNDHYCSLYWPLPDRLFKLSVTRPYDYTHLYLISIETDWFETSARALQLLLQHSIQLPFDWHIFLFLSSWKITALNNFTNCVISFHKILIYNLSHLWSFSIVSNKILFTNCVIFIHCFCLYNVKNVYTWKGVKANWHFRRLFGCCKKKKRQGK